MSDEPLAGRAILVAEDEYYSAIDLCREPVRAGAKVIGPVPSLEKTLALIGSAPHIDAALLDINLGGEMIFPAADRLRERGVPFLFATGYDKSMIPQRFGDITRCEKPIGTDRLSRAVAMLIAERST